MQFFAFLCVFFLLRFRIEKSTHVFFHFTHRHLIVATFQRQLVLILFGNDYQSPGMTCRKPSVFDKFYYVVVQSEQTESISHGRAAFSDTVGGNFLRHVEFRHQSADCPCRLDGGQIFTLQVFNKTYFLYFLRGVVANYCGDFRFPRNAACPETSFAGDYHKTLAYGGNNNRLNYAVGADAFRQFVQRLFVKVFSGLFPVGVNVQKRQIYHTVCSFSRHSGVFTACF